MKVSVNAVKHAFQTRFYDSDLGSWKGMCDLWKRKQGPKETVEESVDLMQKIKRSCTEISDDNVKCAIIMSFRPDIKRHVIQQKPANIEQVIKAAKLAEQAALATEETDTGIAAAISRIESRLCQTEISKQISVTHRARKTKFRTRITRRKPGFATTDTKIVRNPSRYRNGFRKQSDNRSDAKVRFESKSPVRFVFRRKRTFPAGNANGATDGTFRRERPNAMGGRTRWPNSQTNTGTGKALL